MNAAIWSTKTASPPPAFWPEGAKASANSPSVVMRVPVEGNGGAMRRAAAPAETRPPLTRRSGVHGEPHADKITRQRGGRPGLERRERLVPRGFRLAHREAADRQAGPCTRVRDPPQAGAAQLQMGASLEDGP